MFEQDDAIGGLMTYGIPDFKFSRASGRPPRRAAQKKGIVFRVNIEVGRDIPLQRLRHEFDAVCLAIGALEQRDASLLDVNSMGFSMPWSIWWRKTASRPAAR